MIYTGLFHQSKHTVNSLHVQNFYFIMFVLQHFIFLFKKIYHAGFQMLSMALQKLNISPSYNNPLQATNNHNRVLNPLLSLFTHVLLKLVEMMGTEVFFNKFSHKVCLSMHPQSLHLRV